MEARPKPKAGRGSGVARGVRERGTGRGPSWSSRSGWVVWSKLKRLSGAVASRARGPVQSSPVQSSDPVQGPRRRRFRAAGGGRGRPRSRPSFSYGSIVTRGSDLRTLYDLLRSFTGRPFTQGNQQQGSDHSLATSTRRAPQLLPRSTHAYVRFFHPDQQVLQESATRSFGTWPLACIQQPQDFLIHTCTEKKVRILVTNLSNSQHYHYLFLISR